MRKNVNVVAVLFEEVNTLLKTIDRKINDQHQRLEDIVTKADLTSEKIAIEKAFLQTSHNLSVLNQKLNGISTSIHESENQIRSGFESILSTLKDQEDEQITRHKRMLRLTSKQVVMAFVFLFLLFSVSLTGNIYLRKKLKRVSDSDIKYRYIKMVGEISSEDLHKLEGILKHQSDKELIKKIRQEVEDYERKMKLQDGKMENR